MQKLTRRQFVGGSLLAGVTLLGSRSRVLGANDDIRIAVVGIRNKGARHIEAFDQMAGVRVVALCDADRGVLGQRLKPFTDRGDKVNGYVDFREILDRKDVDAVCIATPNHWHTLMTVWGCQAGKDVYVEKPVSHNVREGRQAVAAARKYKRIVQHGTQSRSDTALQEAFAYIQQGKMGRIKHVHGLCYKHRESIGKVSGPQPVPEGVDYNLWSGPAPMAPIMREQFHYDWHWIWSTGNGDIGNQGVHEMDMCRWVLGEQTLPRRVMSLGGRFGYDDDGQTPNTQLAVFDFETAPLLFEVRGLPRSATETAMDAYMGVRVGLVVHCEDGYFAGGAGGGWIFDHDGRRVQQFASSGGDEHQANFIQAMRSRNVDSLTADVAHGHLSSALCHLGNIAFRMGKPVPARMLGKRTPEQLDVLADASDNLVAHLANNGIGLDETPIISSGWLAFDPAKERFTDHDEANALLTRQYREPFVVPDNV